MKKKKYPLNLKNDQNTPEITKYAKKTTENY